MDSSTLYYSLDLVCGGGYTVTGEQRAALHTSLVLLKRDYQLGRLAFWGKILGTLEDYFIAQGVGVDEVKDKTFLYSFNCMDWHLLPPAEDRVVAEVCRAARGRFTGDPSHQYTEPRLTHREGVEAMENEVPVTVTEEQRLAVTVHLIDQEASVVPRGAVTRTPHGRVQPNRSFEGLSHADAGRLDSFRHLAKPKKQKKFIQELADFDPSIDFLDLLSDDIPN
ncbi:hypothetical protein CRUP_021943, partial [Coryphaenoides rupestris]